MVQEPVRCQFWAGLGARWGPAYSLALSIVGVEPLLIQMRDICSHNDWLNLQKTINKLTGESNSISMTLCALSALAVRGQRPRLCSLFPLLLFVALIIYLDCAIVSGFLVPFFVTIEICYYG